jgi:SHS2 domain-containing protein
MMKTSLSGFEILDHPADLGFRAWSPNLPDCFAECARALTSVLVDPELIRASEVKAAEILADDLEGLLYNWLSEILYLFDGEQMLFCQFDIVGHKANGGVEFLQAELKGERYDPARHAIKTYVKAVTFHQLSIKHAEDEYTARVFLDI